MTCFDNDQINTYWKDIDNIPKKLRTLNPNSENFDNLCNDLRKAIILLVKEGVTIDPEMIVGLAIEFPQINQTNNASFSSDYGVTDYLWFCNSNKISADSDITQSNVIDDIENNIMIGREKRKNLKSLSKLLNQQHNDNSRDLFLSKLKCEILDLLRLGYKIPTQQISKFLSDFPELNKPDDRTYGRIIQNQNISISEAIETAGYIINQGIKRIYSRDELLSIINIYDKEK